MTLSSWMRRAVVVGLVLWLLAAYVAVALLAFLLLTTPGLGTANWPELGVSLAVAIGLPAWIVARSDRGEA